MKVELTLDEKPFLLLTEKEAFEKLGIGKLSRIQVKVLEETEIMDDLKGLEETMKTHDTILVYYPSQGSRTSSLLEIAGLDDESKVHYCHAHMIDIYDFIVMFPMLDKHILIDVIHSIDDKIKPHVFDLIRTHTSNDEPLKGKLIAAFYGEVRLLDFLGEYV